MDFEEFPADVQEDMLSALTLLPRAANRITLSRSRVLMVVCLKLRSGIEGDAFRVLYVVKIGEDIWVIHAFKRNQKKGTRRLKGRLILSRTSKRLRRLYNEQQRRI